MLGIHLTHVSVPHAISYLYGVRVGVPHIVGQTAGDGGNVCGSYLQWRYALLIQPFTPLFRGRTQLLYERGRKNNMTSADVLTV